MPDPASLARFVWRRGADAARRMPVEGTADAAGDPKAIGEPAAKVRVP
jgi:hypothetical protein